MTLGAGTRLGPYEIVSPIGAGGMGEVYRARDARLSREVAIKVLPSSFVADPERLRRFEQEARATGQLNHPNILAVYDTGTHDGEPYVVAELLEGETLRQRMGGARLPVRKALDYARQIAQGLAAAHQKGIVHRDLKPENLFVTSDGRVKILDFGLAKLTRPEDGAAALQAMLSAVPTQTPTGAGVVLGTAGYMSPEQVRGLPTDHRSDIFSFGCILYEMLTGRRAFAAASSVETMNAILKEEPTELTQLGLDIPPGLERLVQHALEKSPEERFQSIRDLGFQLEALSSPSSTSAPSHAAHRVARSRRRVLLLPAFVMGALAVGAAYFAGLRSQSEVTPVNYDQLTFRQGSIFSARYTPDGESVIYGAAWDGNPRELFNSRPGSPESRSLGLPSAEILSVSSAGELAILLNPRYTLGWMRSGTLARAPLSGGEPRQVLEEIEDADWAPNGEGLAIARRVAGRYRLEYPVGKVLYETKFWISSPRFSRDGRYVAFVDHPRIGDDRGRLGVVDLAGNVRFLTDYFSTVASLSWSPAPDAVWFSASPVGTMRSLYEVDLKGKQRLLDNAPVDMVIADVSPAGQVLLVRNSARRGVMGTKPGDQTERDLSWLDWSRCGALSLDGHWVLFEEQGKGGGPRYSVYLRNTDGSPPVRLGEGYGTGLSSDGQWVLTTSVSEPDRIDILPRGPGEQRTLRLPGYSVTWSRWFPDDKRLLVLARDSEHLSRLYVMDATGGTPKPITPEGAGFEFAFSPDSRLVATTISGGPVVVFPIEGGEPRTVPGSVAGDLPRLWSSDGRSLFIAVSSSPGVRLDLLDLASGQRTTLRHLAPADKAGLLDVGHVYLSRDAASYVYSYRRVLSTLYQVDGLR